MMTPLIFFLALGVILISVEIVVLQFSVFWVAFIGLGALAAALVCFVVPSLGWVGSTAIFVIASVVITLALLKPLRRWQLAKGPMAGNDAIGQSVQIIVRVTGEEGGKALWSGTEWKAKLAEAEAQPLEPGQAAHIARLEGLTLYLQS